ncbi:methyltransferase type 12 [Paenibacillus elgii]|uniref:Methyltransferase type 12 n=1 Tax=Paenibacillus elgii TaxID=189691 RepID=A0A163XH91_9BACL|nr:class I SAM-dependent methyltransferase [Paenibacillus elgii]KZE77880.1 methyltransferase type 12 [Paenibacillus elgii]
MDQREELVVLEQISQNNLYLKNMNYLVSEYTDLIFSRYMKNDGTVLELGPAEGVMTEKLIKRCDDLTVVEGSKIFCEKISNRFPEINVIHSLIEDFKPNRKFDNIILGHVLEHVYDPIQILSLVKSWLSENGKVFAAVPNSRSLHRQAGVMMGLLDDEKQLNELDLQHGHRRVYDPESFKGDFLSAGYKIDVFGGYLVKLLSNKQIEKNWDPDLIKACFKLGELYPDIAADIYIVASNFR